MFKKLFLSICFLSFVMPRNLPAQQLTQTIRGTVTDKVTHTTLPGANVVILNSNPLLGTATDMDGNFKITGVPLGKHSLRISYLGYKELTIPNIVVNSGKEVVLNVSLEENFIQGKEVVISGEKDKSKTINDMTTVSARTFSVEETQKYAAAVNDPGRMATSFAGVINSEDGGNEISIRGNAPNGLQWRMEGIEIPNPNHFSSPGASGGGISILSAQTMSNSDFMTGAFPAEYGNALSGVFDIRLRKGNNEKREYTFQAGLLGIDVASEGPFKEGYRGSYLVNYRYSTLSLLGNLGVNVGEGSNDFQDISYNVSLPAGKAGNFTLFGFGGLSTYKHKAKRDSSEWENGDERYTTEFNANTGAAGVTHSIILGKDTYLKSAFLASMVAQNFISRRLDDELNNRLWHDEYSDLGKLTLSSSLNHKFSSRHSIRTGIIVNNLSYDVRQISYDKDIDDTKLNLDKEGSTYSMQLFAHSNYYITENLSLNAGVHYIRLTLNNSYSIEPRASLKYDITKKQSVSIGYGLHSQLLPIGVYFAEAPGAGRVNKKLEMSKSHHLVVAYDRMLTESMRFKSEVYYQNLFDIPVRSDIKNSFSMVNLSGGYVTDPLVNEGTGTNYGLELTVEQFLKKNYYFLVSGSLYESKYKGSDGIERNTRYNGNHGFSLTAGKEWVMRARYKSRVIGFNFKTIYRGGFRDTPIDLEATHALPGQGTVYDETKAFTIQYPGYFRADIRISLKRNRPNSTQTLALDIQNATNHKNIYGKFFNEESQTVKTYYQTPMIPVLSYKIEF